MGTISSPGGTLINKAEGEEEKTDGTEGGGSNIRRRVGFTAERSGDFGKWGIWKKNGKGRGGGAKHGHACILSICCRSFIRFVGAIFSPSAAATHERGFLPYSLMAASDATSTFISASSINHGKTAPPKMALSHGTTYHKEVPSQRGNMPGGLYFPEDWHLSRNKR